MGQADDVKRSLEVKNKMHLHKSVHHGHHNFGANSKIFLMILKISIVHIQLLPIVVTTVVEKKSELVKLHLCWTAVSRLLIHVEERATTARRSSSSDEFRHSWRSMKDSRYLRRAVCFSVSCLCSIVENTSAPTFRQSNSRNINKTVRFKEDSCWPGSECIVILNQCNKI